MNNSEAQKLVKAAEKARTFAIAKYSNFPVGAALITNDGNVINGCNIESSSYSLTICAERVALTKALSDGIKNFEAIAIVAKDGDFCPPCGACRQLLYDYAPDLEVILSDGNDIKTYKIKELLPLAFEDSQLG